MSADVEIDGWLAGLGFGPGASRERARAALEEAQLTRPGKTRISSQKLERASGLLAGRFSLHCPAGPCLDAARRSGREPLPAATKAHCEHCGGSDNARAAQDLLDACGRVGIRKLLVVGGSPAVREELRGVLGTVLELRTVDGTERRTGERARSDLEWADLVLLWGGTELDHKVSAHYAHPPAALRRRVVHVARRGIAALLGAAVEHLRRNP
ncbi:MAG TPA: hypothetical protein VEJ89_18670 [Myxococcaceae bacterium]|nr:hypothetical protein [Myxococcaceae bacterium]